MEFKNALFNLGSVGYSGKLLMRENIVVSIYEQGHLSPNVLCLTAIAQILKERQDPMCPWRFCTGHNAPEAKNQWDDMPLMFLYQVLVTILIKWYLRF